MGAYELMRGEESSICHINLIHSKQSIGTLSITRSRGGGGGAEREGAEAGEADER